MTWLVAGAVIGSMTIFRVCLRLFGVWSRDLHLCSIWFESRLCYQGKTCQRSPLWAILLPKALESTSPCQLESKEHNGTKVKLVSREEKESGCRNLAQNCMTC
jgi:hypothetical protein